MKYINNAGLELEVVSRVGKQCVVVFTKSGSTRKANIDNIKAGKVKDLYSPSRYGIGYDGEFIKVPYWRRAKDLWSNMIKRCYFEGDNKGYFGKAIVDPRWHCFGNFLADIKELPGFKDWVNKKGMELDKDKISKSKVYSKHTCQFLTTFENRHIQGDYRVGKTYCKETRSWVTSKI